MKFRGLLAVAAIGFSSFSYANPYFGAGIGVVEHDSSNLRNFDEPIGLQLYLGNRFNENLALELGYVYFGESDDGIYPVWTLSASSLKGGGKFIAPITRGVDIYAQAGLHFWDTEISEQGYGTFYNDDGVDLYYGFGGVFQLDRNIGIGIEYTLYNFDYKYIGDVETSYLGANLEFGF